MTHLTVRNVPAEVSEALMAEKDVPTGRRGTLAVTNAVVAAAASIRADVCD